MKLSGTIVSIAGSVVVLSAALVVGLGVREIRTRKALEMRREVVNVEQARADTLARRTGPMARRTGDRMSPDQIRGDREDMRARYDNMSDEERSQFSRERTSRFRADGGGGFGQGRTGQFGGAMGGADREAMRARFENMTEEERQAAIEEMRQRFGGMRSGRSRRGSFGEGGGMDGGFRRPGGDGSFGGGPGSGGNAVEGAQERPADGN